MAGNFGIASKRDCVKDLFRGTFYLQHRAQDYCGLFINNGAGFDWGTHKGLLRQQFPKEVLERWGGNYGMGSVAGCRQPVTELSKSGGMIIGFDGNLVNHAELKNSLLKSGRTFSAYCDPEHVNDVEIVSKIISSEGSFESGIERLVETMQGDFAIIAMKKDGIYAARGWGRKPLIIGERNDAYAVSSESNSFPNTGFEIARDVPPGEVIRVNEEGVETLKQLDLKPIKFGTFEWIYTSHPASVIDGRSVSEVRKRLGAALARRFPVKADLVSPIPNSGRWHAIGYAMESKIPYTEEFVRYDYSDRSYTPSEQDARNEEAETKLIPIEGEVRGKKIVVVDDSIVRGTQMLNRVKVLTDLGAEEVHARIACPPLMHACNYGKTTKKDEDCIARRMSIEDIQSELRLKTLGFATVKDLEKATGLSKSQLCLECWVD